MIRIAMRYSGGILRHVRSDGHAAGGSTGGSASGLPSAPCAVVSNVLLALGRACINYPGVELRGAAPQPGLFELDVDRVAPEARDYVAGIGQLVRLQLQAAVAGFPEDISLDIIDEEQIDGTQKRRWQFKKRA